MILEADITSYFDSIDRKWLMESSGKGLPTRRCCDWWANACTWGAWTARSTPSRTRAPRRARSIAATGNVYLPTCSFMFERDVRRGSGAAQWSGTPMIRHGLRTRGRRETCDGRLATALRAVRTDSALGKDPRGAVREAPQGPSGGKDLRPSTSWGSRITGGEPTGSVDNRPQDSHGALRRQSRPSRLVSQPSHESVKEQHAALIRRWWGTTTTSAQRNMGIYDDWPGRGGAWWKWLSRRDK